MFKLHSHTCLNCTLAGADRSRLKQCMNWGQVGNFTALVTLKELLGCCWHRTLAISPTSSPARCTYDPNMNSEPPLQLNTTTQDHRAAQSNGNYHCTGALVLAFGWCRRQGFTSSSPSRDWELHLKGGTDMRVQVSLVPYSEPSQGKCHWLGDIQS